MAEIAIASSPDPDDRLFLAVAQEAGILVTGNMKHFPKKVRGTATVVSPGEFRLMLPA